MDERELKIIAQSILRGPWIGSKDDEATVTEKFRFQLDIVLNKVHEWALDVTLGKAAPRLKSKQWETRVTNAMEAAIEADDHGAIFEIWTELEHEEQVQLANAQDRWRRNRWKQALEAATATVNNTPDPRFMEPMG